MSASITYFLSGTFKRIAPLFLLALSLGVLAARRPGGLADRFALLFSLLGLSLPNFWLGPLLAIAGKGRLTNNVTVHALDPTRLVAERTTEYFPVCAGWPVIKPVFGSNAKPVGKPVAPYASAPFLTMIWWWKGRSIAATKNRGPTPTGVAKPRGKPLSARL